MAEVSQPPRRDPLHQQQHELFHQQSVIQLYLTVDINIYWPTFVEVDGLITCSTIPLPHPTHASRRKKCSQTRETSTRPVNNPTATLARQSPPLPSTPHKKEDK